MKLSVIVPVYNVEKYITKCIKSICNQTLKDIEIICIDDCGNDNSMEIINNYSKTDSRIKIIKNEKNMGLGYSRNIGVSNAIGKYIACIDSDDWIAEDMFEKCFKLLEKLKLDSVWVKVNTYIQKTNQYTTNNYYKQLYEYNGGLLYIDENNINNFPVNAWNKVYRTSFLKDNNIKWSEGFLYEDLEFYYSFYTKSKKTYLIDELLYIYRWHDKSIMGKTNKGLCRVEDIYDVTYNIYNNLINNNILNKFEYAFLQLVERNIKLFYEIPYYTKRVKKYSKKLLKLIYFPERYSNIKDFQYLIKFISNYKKIKLLLLNFITKKE